MFCLLVYLQCLEYSLAKKSLSKNLLSDLKDRLSKELIYLKRNVCSGRTTRGRASPAAKRLGNKGGEALGVPLALPTLWGGFRRVNPATASHYPACLPFLFIRLNVFSCVQANLLTPRSGWPAIYGQCKAPSPGTLNKCHILRLK